MTNASYKTFLHQLATGKIDTDKTRLYNYILKFPKLTLNEIRINLNMKHQTISARLSDLLDMGVVFISGTKERKNSERLTLDSILEIEENESKIQANFEKRQKQKVKQHVSYILKLDISENLRLELNNLIK